MQAAGAVLLGGAGAGAGVGTGFGGEDAIVDIVGCDVGAIVKTPLLGGVLVVGEVLLGGVGAGAVVVGAGAVGAGAGAGAGVGTCARAMLVWGLAADVVLLGAVGAGAGVGTGAGVMLVRGVAAGVVLLGAVGAGAGVGTCSDADVDARGEDAIAEIA